MKKTEVHRVLTSVIGHNGFRILKDRQIQIDALLTSRDITAIQSQGVNIEKVHGGTYEIKPAKITPKNNLRHHRTTLKRPW